MDYCGGFQLVMGVARMDGVCVRENLTKIDDDWGTPHLWNPHISRQIFIDDSLTIPQDLEVELQISSKTPENDHGQLHRNAATNINRSCYSNH